MEADNKQLIYLFFTIKPNILAYFLVPDFIYLYISCGILTTNSVNWAYKVTKNISENKIYTQKYEAAQLFSTLIIIGNVSWAANHHFRIISEDWSNDAENSDFHHRNKLYFNIYSNRKQLFQIVIIFSQYYCFIFTVFWSNKWSLCEHKIHTNV